jgi:hypothetical protein
VSCASFSVAVAPTAESLADPVHHVPGPVLGDHPDDDPPAFLESREPANVPHVLTPAGPMLLAVVLDRYLVLLPTHVQYGN